MVDLINTEAEQAVLGCILNDNRQLARLGSLVGEEDFAEPLHREIWRECSEKIASGAVASPITMIASESAKAAGVPGYLAKLAGLGAAILDVKHFALVVSGLAKRRMMIAVAENMKAMAEDFTRTEAEHIGEAVKLLSEARQSTRGMSAEKLARKLLTDMDLDLPCFSTGFPLLDTAMAGGVYECRSYVFSGRPKSGKTMTACSISNNMGKAGIPHLFIAAEMGIEQIHQRNLAADLNDCAIGFIKPRGSEQSRSFKAALEHHLKDYKSPIYFEDAPGITFNELRMLVANHVRRGIRGFVLDGMWLIGGKEKGVSDASHTSMIADWIAAVTKRENIWALSTYQLNRDGDMLGSDGPLRAADQVYRIHRPSDDKPGIWLEMRESRYTPGANVGSKDNLLMEIYKGSCIRQTFAGNATSRSLHERHHEGTAA